MAHYEIASSEAVMISRHILAGYKAPVRSEAVRCDDKKTAAFAGMVMMDLLSTPDTGASAIEELWDNAEARS